MRDRIEGCEELGDLWPRLLLIGIGVWIADDEFHELLVILLRILRPVAFHELDEFRRILGRETFAGQLKHRPVGRRVRLLEKLLQAPVFRGEAHNAKRHIRKSVRALRGALQLVQRAFPAIDEIRAPQEIIRPGQPERREFRRSPRAPVWRAAR
ncbi:MAG: hypothetical protein WDN28_08730 [Chthoniobacter sp.]